MDRALLVLAFLLGLVSTCDLVDALLKLDIGFLALIAAAPLHVLRYMVQLPKQLRLRNLRFCALAVCRARAPGHFNVPLQQVVQPQAVFS